MKTSVACRATVASTAGAVALLVAPSMSAQEATQDTGGLQEVVVSARYREENLQQTPIAITAITAEDLQQRGFTTAADVAYTVPNASFRPAQAAFGNTMTAFIRGIGQNDFLPEFEPGVGIYFDDVLHPVTMGSMVDLMDLERVEVLRGPQGTLFGRGSIGGAVRYVSRQPRGDNTGNISVTYGRFDRIDLRASYDFSLTDNLFARVTGVSKNRDGFQEVLDFACANPSLAGSLPVRVPNRGAGCRLGTQGGEDVQGARGALRWLATESLEFTLSADYLNDESEVRADTLVDIAGPGGPFQVWSEHYLLPRYGVEFDRRFVSDNPYVSYATYDDPLSGLKFEPRTSLEQSGVAGKADWRLNDDVRAELILSYREFNGQFATDTDQSPVNEQTADGRQDFESRTAELRFSGRLADRADWTVGAFFYNGSFNSAQTVSIPALIFAGAYNAALDAGATEAEAEAQAAAAIESGNGRFLVNGNNQTDSENRSVFAHVVYDLTDQLSLTGGVRYSEDDKDERFDNTIIVQTLGTSEDHFDWKLGVDYKFTDTFLAYASAATGYRPQSFNPRPFQRTQFVGVDGEEATSYEVGIKTDLLERRLRVNTAVFYVDYSKRIVPVPGTECNLLNPAGNDPPIYDTVPPGTPDAIVDSLGNTCLNFTSRTLYQNFPGIIRGAELEVAFRPLPALTINGSYGYTDFSASDLDAANIVNERPAFVPKQNWSIAALYEFGLGSGSTITPRIDVFGQGEICTNTTTKASCSEGYELVNARLEWANADRSWTAAFGALNVTNEKYFLNKFDLSAFGQPTTEGQPGAPREWYFSVTRNF